MLGRINVRVDQVYEWLQTMRDAPEGWVVCVCVAVEI